MNGIVASGLTRRYGQLAVVDAIDFTIAPGEFVCFLGPSGSGKTTTLRMLAGLERPDGGTVALNGRTMSGPGIFVPPAQRRLGMVFQSYAVWPHKTVAENVAFPLEQQGVPRAEREQRVLRMLDRVGLGGLADRNPGQLSGGQQQRVSLARALAATPGIVLFDEPLSNLDAQLRDAMRSLIAELHAELRFMAVYVTHDQAEAMTISDRILIMRHGAILQAGTARELYLQPSSVFVAEFLGQANVLLLSRTDLESAWLASGERIQLGVAVAGKQSATHLMIRPHELVLWPQPETPSLEAVVTRVIFLGDRLRCELQAHDTKLILDAAPEAVIPVPGQVVRVGLPLSACRLL